jgi:hypothetical protein
LTQGTSNLLKNLCKFFVKRALFCFSISITPSTPSSFGIHTIFQAALGVFLHLCLSLSKAVFPEFVNLFDDALGQNKGTHKEGWKSSEHCLSELQPSSLVHKGGNFS